MTRLVAEFAGDERGMVTIEFVLWVPIIVALLVTAIDGTILYVTHTEMWNVSRDTARRMVTGKILSIEEAEAFAANSMSMRDYPYTVEATYDKDDVVQVKMGIEYADLSILGYGSPLAIFGRPLVASVVMRPDPRIPFETGG